MLCEVQMELLRFMKVNFNSERVNMVARSVLTGSDSIVIKQKSSRKRRSPISK